jgi:hypothetical protein
VAIQWSCFDVDDLNHFGAFDSVVVGAQSDPDHRSGVYRHLAGGFQPKLFLSPAIELTPGHSTFGTGNDKPTQNAQPTVVVCGPVVQRSMVRPRDGIRFHSLRQPVVICPGRGAAGAEAGI